MLILFAVSGGLVGFLPFILMVLAALLFGFAVWGRFTTPEPSVSRLRFVAAGLLCWSVALLIQMAGGLF